MLALCLASCAAAAPRATYPTSALTQSQNEFAIDLFGQLAKKPGNFSFAPYSVATALGMVYAGTGGSTAAQTHDKIPTLVSPEMLTPPPGLVLTNAVYFKAGWALPFHAFATQQAPFHVAPGNDVTVSTMNMTDDLAYAAGDRLQLLRLNYRYGDTLMVIILPNDKTALADIESHLTAAKLKSLIAKIQYPLVLLSLPKFTADSTFDLEDMLQSLGITRAFDPKGGDFSAITMPGADPLQISHVIHKAHIDVDEVGTEAAAATTVITSVAGAVLAMGPSPTPIPFIADHPFLYLIIDNATGQILFMGRMTNPAS